MGKVILSTKGEEYVHQVDGVEEDFDEDAEESTLNCLQFQELLSVARCTLAELKVSDD